MSTLSCYVYCDQDAPYWVSIGLLTCTSLLTPITLCQVSPNLMAVPKPILLKDEATNNIYSNESKHPFLRNRRSKYTGETFDPTFMGYT